MKVLNLLASGNTGGIEVLCKNILLKSKEDNRICCLFKEGEVYNELKEQSKKVFSTANMKKNFINITDFLVDYCKKEKIDIIIIHHSGLACNIIYLMLKKKLKNVKFVRYLHECFEGDPFTKYKNPIKKGIEKKIMGKALKKSDLIIYISNAVRKSHESLFDVKDVKSRVIYNGIPDNFFEGKKIKDIDKDIKIAFVGRIEKVKGVNLLIDAFKKVLEHRSTAKLIIVGDGNQKNVLEEKTNKEGIGEQVKFLGRKKDVLPILDEANIFVYPSIWEEGFGISVIEAMARGCIPITFRKGGLSEIIENNKNGILVDEVSSDSLAKAILKVISMSDEQKKLLMEETIKRAKDFSLNNTINNIENSLKSIL